MHGKVNAILILAFFAGIAGVKDAVAQMDMNEFGPLEIAVNRARCLSYLEEAIANVPDISGRQAAPRPSGVLVNRATNSVAFPGDLGGGQITAGSAALISRSPEELRALLENRIAAGLNWLRQNQAAVLGDANFRARGYVDRLVHVVGRVSFSAESNLGERHNVTTCNAGGISAGACSLSGPALERDRTAACALKRLEVAIMQRPVRPEVNEEGRPTGQPYDLAQVLRIQASARNVNVAANAEQAAQNTPPNLAPVASRGGNQRLESCQLTSGPRRGRPCAPGSPGCSCPAAPAMESSDSPDLSNDDIDGDPAGIGHGASD